MGKKGNDKGFITWIMTLITMILSVGFVIGAITSFATLISGGFGTWAIVSLTLAIIGLFAAIYIVWHGTMILLGKGENTWTFVILAFFAGVIGGILMLIAKILN